jgi:hypothetical protein
MSNYISQIITENTVCSIYRTKVFFLASTELNTFLSLNYSEYLRCKIRYPNMIDATSSESSFILPNYVDANRLIESIRSICGKATILINVWMKEMNCSLLDGTFETYKDFFSQSLTHMLSVEKDLDVIDLIFDLKKSLEEIYPYLGYYDTNFSTSICTTEEAIAAGLFLIFMNGVQN